MKEAETDAGTSAGTRSYEALPHEGYWTEYHETSLEALVEMFAQSFDDVGRQDRVGLRYWFDSRTQSVVIRIDLCKDDQAA